MESFRAEAVMRDFTGLYLAGQGTITARCDNIMSAGIGRAPVYELAAAGYSILYSYSRV